MSDEFMTAYAVDGVPCGMQPCPLRHLHDHQRGPHTRHDREVRAARARLFTLYIAHARGVADGAGRRSMSKSTHRSSEARAAYERGYTTGQALTRDACARFGAEIGYAPTVVAACESPRTCSCGRQSVTPRGWCGRPMCHEDGDAGA